MYSFINFTLLLVLVCWNLVVEATDDCKPERCKMDGPLIKFPFRNKDSHPQHCGYPGFDLSCNQNNETVLQQPFSLNFTIQKIDYLYQTVQFSDPKKCLTLNVDLSNSPFNYYRLKPHVLFNCSLNHIDLYPDAPCLGTATGYTVRFILPSARTDWLINCSKIHGVGYAPDPDDYILAYDRTSTWFSWTEPDCRHCEVEGRYCRLNNSTIECSQGKSRSLFASRKSISGLISVLGSFAFVATLAALYYLYRTIKTDKKMEKFLQDYKALKPVRFSYADIRRITKDFSEKLGEGGYGVVYKGKLSNDIYVAVKLLNNTKGNGVEFINEVSTIGSIHHVNVVRLVGFCADCFKRALVYDYLPNDSLEKFIFRYGPKKNSLSYQKMQDIAIGTAKGIEYLHQGCDQQILHFDIKPHNILLDHNFNPKICDFGLAKFCSKEQSAVSMTDARGTMGYIAPEMMSRTFGRVSFKSDVYSFGMLLLEMVGGRKNMDTDNRKVYFPKWIYSQLNEAGNLLETIGESNDDTKIVKKLTIVGLWSIQWYPADRPSMKEVLQMLEGDGENLTLPPDPFPGANLVSSVAGMKGVNGRFFQTELAAVAESDDIV